MGCTLGKSNEKHFKNSNNFKQSNFSELFKGKNFFITGGTGYFGKSIIEKLLRCYPTLNRIYVLVRSKKELTAGQNFQKNLIESPIIQKLNNSLVKQKLVFIEGDISQNYLGLDEPTQTFIQDNIHYIIHCAASLEFSPPLIQNTLLNVRSTLQLYEMVKNSKSLEHFIFVSSTYSQGNRSGLIEETIFQNQCPLEDPEEIYNNILKQELSKKEQQEIIGEFPNCYCFTKNLCEQILQKKQKVDQNVTVTVFRPSVIFAMNEEPIPGYIDQLIGLGIVYYYIGTGQLKYIYTDRDMVIDAIPCDVSVSQLIMSLGILANNNKMNVVNSGTSNQNPLKNHVHFDICVKFWTENRVKKAKKLPQCEYYSDFNQIKEKHQEMRLQAEKIGDQKEKSTILGLIEKSLMLNGVYKNINNHEMIFESKMVYKMAQQLGKKDRMILKNWDVRDIDWVYTVNMFQYGLQKYILKEDIQVPLFIKKSKQEQIQSLSTNE